MLIRQKLMKLIMKKLRSKKFKYEVFERNSLFIERI